MDRISLVAVIRMGLGGRVPLEIYFSFLRGPRSLEAWLWLFMAKHFSTERDFSTGFFFGQVLKNWSLNASELGSLLIPKRV